MILAESVPAGTTTAYATAKALGYSVDGLFSSSFRDAPTIKEKTINRAIENIDLGSDIFEILGAVSDNMLIFNARFYTRIKWESSTSFGWRYTDGRSSTNCK